MEMLQLSAFYVALASLALGGSVLARNPKNKLYWSFFLLTTVVSLWAGFFYLAGISYPKYWYRLHLVANLWLAPFSLRFIQEITRSHSSRVVSLLTGLSTMGAIVLTAILFTSGNFLRNDFFKDVVLFFPAFMVLALVWLFVGDLRRDRVQWVGVSRTGRLSIYVGGILAAAVGVMDHVPGLGTVLPSVGNFIIIFYLFFISRALTQLRRIDVEALVSKFLVLLVIGLVLIGVYLAIFAANEKSPLRLVMTHSFFVSFLILTVMDPLRTFVAMLTPYFFTKEHRRLMAFLKQAERKLLLVSEEAQLQQNLFETLDHLFRPDEIRLYLINREGSKFKRIKSKVLPTVDRLNLRASPREVLASYPLVDYSLKKFKDAEPYAVFDQILKLERERTASRSERKRFDQLLDALQSLGCNHWIPLVLDERIIGFVCLVSPESADTRGRQWGLVQLILPYFGEVARLLNRLEGLVAVREQERLAALGEMAAGLAHEIRNPLGSIRGAAQLLTHSESQNSELLNVILEEVDRLNGVVSDFLDFARPHETHAGEVDVVEIVNRTLALLKPTLPPDISIEVRVGKDVRPIMGVQVQVHQLVLNLVKNSLQSLMESRGEDTPRKVTVDLDSDFERGELKLVVEDNGPGIESKHIDKIFIPFFSTSPRGTGLGLSICRRIVDAHSGRIEVDTEKGRYARFTVSFPYSHAGN